MQEFCIFIYILTFQCYAYLTLFIFIFRHGEANGHKIPPKSVRTAGGTPPCRKAGEGASIGERSETIQAPSPALRQAY